MRGREPGPLLVAVPCAFSLTSPGCPTLALTGSQAVSAGAGPLQCFHRVT